MSSSQSFSPALLLAGLLLAALAMPAAAQAAETVNVGSCQAALWSGLPLAKQQTPSASYDPTSYEYYHDWALKHVLPPFVFSCIAAALLLAFTLWRAIKLCTCMRCIRGPQRRSRAAADTLGARRHRLLQAGVCLLACGVAAGAGYGLSTIQPALQPRGVGVFEQAKAYVADGLATANSTIGSVAMAEADVADIRQRVEDLNLEQLQPGTLAMIAGFQRDLGSVLAGMRSAAADIQRLVLDKMQQLQDDWQPRLDKLDVAKNTLLYAAYIFIIAAAVAVGLAVALNCPSVASGSLFVLLVMMVLAWSAVWASTAGLKVGSDGCAVVEQKIITALTDAAEEQVATGSGLLSTVGVGDTLALARYYLWGTGRDPTEILADLTGWNVWDLINESNNTVSGLRAAAYLVQGINSSIATLPNNLETLADDIEAVAANVSMLEGALSHERFHPVYLAAKEYACCDVLNWLGGLWLGLLIVGCAGVPMALLAFWWLGRMDKLEPNGCCHVYRRADYERFDSERGIGAAEAPLGDKKDEEALGSRASDGLGPTTAADFSLSLQRKFAAAAAAGALHPADRDELIAPTRGDAFRIGAANVDGTPAHSARGVAAELSDLLPEGTPSAPPLSARSLGSTRYGYSRAAVPVGTWAGTGSAPISARGLPGSSEWPPVSAPGSALPSARTGSQTSTGMLRLTPAAEALMPPEQQLLASRIASESTMGGAASQIGANGSSGEVAAEASSSGGASALKRAGNALAHLKWKRRTN